jgi:hypothetical protein
MRFELPKHCGVFLIRLTPALSRRVTRHRRPLDAFPVYLARQFLALPPGESVMPPVWPHRSSLPRSASARARRQCAYWPQPRCSLRTKCLYQELSGTGSFCGVLAAKECLSPTVMG